MKAFYKVSLIVGGCICGLGVILALIGLCIAGFDVKNFIPEGSKMLEKTYTSEVSGLDSLEIQMSNRKVNLILTDDEELKIVYRVVKRQEPYTVITDEVSDGKRLIQIKDGVSTNLLDHLQVNLFFWETNDVDIYLPKSYQNDLTLQTSNASIHTGALTLNGRLSLKTSNSGLDANALRAKELLLQSTNGKITLESCTAEETLDVHTTNGGITLAGVAATDITVSTTNGHVALHGIEPSGLLEVENKNGRIDCEDVTVSQAFFSTTNAAIDLNRVVAESKLSAQTTNGRLGLERIQSSNITLISTNAAVTGSIVGSQADYNITSATSNADNNLPTQINAIAGKQLSIKTTNGKINVQFVD